MQVVEKMHHINVNLKGKRVNTLLSLIKKFISKDIDEWDYYSEMKSRLTPAKTLKIRRQNIGLSQIALAEKCGITYSNIVLMETGKQNIGIESAKKLAEALNCDASDFVV